MKRNMIFASTALAMVGLAILTVAAKGDQEEHETQVTLDQVPAAVKATLLKEAAGNKVSEIEQETLNGKTVYEAEFLRNGKETEVTIAADGSVLGREDDNEADDDDDSSLKNVPAPARAALRKLAGDSKDLEVDREVEDGVTLYEAGWMANGKRKEATVMEDGTLVETEETISVDQVPASLRRIITDRYGSAKVKIEKKMVVVYEFEAPGRGEASEINVLPTGRILKDIEHDGESENDHERGHEGEEEDDD